MSTLYKVCLRLIEQGRTEGLADKLAVFYANGQLTAEEYEDLMGRLVPPNDEEEE